MKLNDSNIRISFETQEWLDKWNDKYCEFVQNKDIDVNEAMADWCEQIILEAKNAYYNTSTSIMEDGDYDTIEGRLKILRPDSNVLVKVGG